MPTENGIEIQGEDINDFLSSLGFGCVLELQIKKPTRSPAMNAYFYVVLSKAAKELKCTIERLKYYLKKSYLIYVLKGEHNIDKESIAVVGIEHPISKKVCYELKSTSQMTDGELSAFLEWCVSVIKMVLPNFEAPDPAKYGKEAKNAKNEFLVDRNKKSFLK